MTKPQVTSYLSVHQYLQDLYTYHKSQVPRFSYDLWSRQLGLKSRSYLRMVVVGKRGLTTAFTETFCQKMAFTEKDSVYFKNLVLYSQCRSHEQKKFYGKKLVDLLKDDVNPTEISQYYEFFSSPFLLQLLTLLSFDDIKKDSTHLAALLQSDVKNVETALAQLDSMNLVASKKLQTGDISWEAKNKIHKVPEKLGSAALAEFHAASLREAIRSQKRPVQERRFRSVFIPFSATEYNDFLQDLESFIQHSLFKFQTDELQGRKLYQVNFNNFSVSENPADVLADELK